MGVSHLADELNFVVVKHSYFLFFKRSYAMAANLIFQKVKVSDNICHRRNVSEDWAQYLNKKIDVASLVVLLANYPG